MKKDIAEKNAAKKAKKAKNVASKGAAPVADRRRAYVAVVADDRTYRLGIATEGEAGYDRIREDSDAGAPFASMDDANRAARAYNDGLGLSEKDAMDIVLSTIGAQMASSRRPR